MREYVSISPEGVTYIGQNGAVKKARAPLVVCSTGTEPQHAEAAAFYGTAPLVKFLGDCNRAGDIHKAVTAGWSAANML